MIKKIKIKAVLKMQLPPYERVIYQRNPLIEVVCQLYFPTILRINNQEPWEFQEAIREDYPIYQQTQPNIPPELLDIVKKLGTPLPNQNIIHNFKSEDLTWQLSINKDLITLATTKYEKYEQFETKLKTILNIFEEIYHNKFYLKINLIYKDLIQRSKLNILDVNWSELIQPEIASELHNPIFSPCLSQFLKRMEIQLDEGKLNLNHGLVMATDSETQTQELCYLLDANFFREGKQENEYVWNTLRTFNKLSGQLFRWSITDKLHNAMLPEPIK